MYSLSWRPEALESASDERVSMFKVGVDVLEMFVWEVEGSERVGVFPTELVHIGIKQAIQLKKVYVQRKKIVIC